MDVTFLILFILASIGLYFLPAIIAFTRNHHQKAAISVLTLVGGWSGIGWIVALVWACTQVRRNVTA